jgi:predicted PurR-regulated permease PerM
MNSKEMPHWIPRATFTVIACCLASYAIFWMALQLRELIAWLIVALFLSFALEPLTNKLEHRGWKRGTATGVILAGVLGFFTVFVGSMVPLVVDQLRELIRDTPGFIGQINQFMQETFDITLSTDDLVARTLV